ncbi:MAG: HEPN domain-containing protein [Gemmatimonadetes bacterium]|nr:HEPN domain-containing protein [Gemmatimonadota bacterium]
MPPDPEHVAETRSWFMKAARDLRAAERDLADAPPLLDHAVFNAQQAAEKSMKGLLTWHNRPFRKTHNLVELGEACAAVEPSLADLLRRAAPLTEYAWRFRYPGEPEEPAREEAEGALRTARELNGALLEQLPADAKP